MPQYIVLAELGWGGGCRCLSALNGLQVEKAVCSVVMRAPPK